MRLRNAFACLIALTVIMTSFSSCSDSDKKNDPAPASCIDGIQNQNETGIDCGGPCTPCPSCTDGVKNQNETGIDCGGICPPCATGTPAMTAKVDNVNWSAGTPITVNNSPANKITIIGISSTAGTRITLNYTGPFAVGTVNLGPTFTMEYRDAAGTLYGGISGSITFSEFNTTTKVVSGTFQGQVKYNIGNITKTITLGDFDAIAY